MSPRKNKLREMEKAPEKNIIRLGWVALLNDISGETIMRLVPFYVSGVLGAPMSVVGAIEGFADATSTLLKPFFGRISDRLGKRKQFVVFGYAIPGIARPLLALAASPLSVGCLRVADRFAKAVRTGPRDALISVTPSEKKQGWRFGINRTMDTLGALLGVALFALFVYRKTGGGGSSLQLTAGEWQALCVAALVPAAACLAIVSWGIAEIDLAPKAGQSPERRDFSPVLRKYLFAVTLFGLASSSDAFILLRGKDLGFSLLQTLGMICMLNLASSATALPAAVLSDRLGRKSLITAGWLVYIVVYALIGLGLGSSPIQFAVLLAFYGLFYGFTEGVEKAWIADLTQAEDRGRAYGWFGMITGFTALPASVVFGWAWDRFGDKTPFLADAALAALAIGVLWILVPNENGPNEKGRVAFATRPS